MKAQNSYTRNYFLGTSVILLVLGLIAFSDNLIFDVGQESNRNPVFITHGLLMFAWLGVLMAQAYRIRRSEIKQHMQFGSIGFLVGLTIVVSTAYIYLFVVETAWSDLTFNARANRIFLPTFALMALAAFVYRRRAELHKHLIFVGMFLILEPILTRVGVRIGANPFVSVPILWFSLWISLFVYDFMSKRRIHPVSYCGVLFWCVVYALVV